MMRKDSVFSGSLESFLLQRVRMVDFLIQATHKKVFISIQVVLLGLWCFYSFRIGIFVLLNLTSIFFFDLLFIRTTHNVMHTS